MSRPGWTSCSALGHGYADLVPAMQRVVQAAGRVLRNSKTAVGCGCWTTATGGRGAGPVASIWWQVAKGETLANTRPVAPTQYISPMKSAVIPPISVEPELRAEPEALLRPGETLIDFVEASVRNAIAFRRVQTAFHTRAQAASEACHQSGGAVPVEAVHERLQCKLHTRRKKLGR